MAMRSPTSPASQPARRKGFRAAFARTARHRAALRPEDLLPINLDVERVVVIVLGALPRIEPLRDAVVAALPTFPIAQVDALEAYAGALAVAQTMYRAASTPPDDVPALAERAFAIRALLLSDARALAKRGLIEAGPLARLEGGHGYLDLASDLAVIARLLRVRWREIASSCAITPAELDEAEALPMRLTEAIASRTRRPARMGEVADTRQRAFTLLVRAYDEARRAIAYLRWHERDVDAIAPSIWAGRASRKPKARAAPPAPPATSDASLPANDAGPAKPLLPPQEVARER